MGKKLIRRKEGTKRLPLYKKCEKCGSHSYLTVARFYLCTNENCKHKENTIINDKSIQVEIDYGEEDEEEM